MRVYGYIFLALEKEHLQEEEQQLAALNEYAQSIGLKISELFVERKVSLKQPFRERAEGRRLIDESQAGDIVLTMKSEWVLCSASEGGKLLELMGKKNIALYCADLGENISVTEKRKLVVSEGYAGIVKKLLSALAICESSGHGEAIRATKRDLKKKGKYLGGPVPFGWKVNEDKVLVENKEQQQVIQEIIAMRKDRWSYRDIARKLKDEFDIQLSHAGVRRILESNEKKKAALATTKNPG